MSIDARISTGLPAHPKTKKLARRLGAAGPLGCIYLFLWAAANRSDGDLTGLSDEDIELAIDWAGGEGAFVAAMVEVGFLDGAEGARQIHDWAEHNPWAAGAEARSEKSRWAALCKQHGRQEAARQMPEYAKRIGNASQKVLDAVPDGASGTHLADSGSAPSPFLSDSLPSPSPKAKTPPDPPAGGNAPEIAEGKKPKRTAKIGLDAFLQTCREQGEKPIPADDAVFGYADRIGLPAEFVALAWRWFKARYGDKRQAGVRGWRQTFRNAVEGNWPKFWFADDAGGWQLTTAGRQAQIAADADFSAEEAA